MDSLHDEMLLDMTLMQENAESVPHFSSTPAERVRRTNRAAA